METLFCEKLAWCLCMKPLQSPSLEPVLLSTKSVATGDSCSNNPLYHNHPTDSGRATSNDPIKELLVEIRDILKTRVQNEAEQSYEDATQNKMKDDWMLAAAVLDRIFSIALTIVFIGGTFLFVILFASHSITVYSADK